MIKKCYTTWKKEKNKKLTPSDVNELKEIMKALIQMDA